MTTVKPSYRQAIRTKYHGPTNNKGARIVVSAEAGRITVPWSYELGTVENHALACKVFAEKWEWDGEYSGGAFGDSMYWVEVR